MDLLLARIGRTAAAENGCWPAYHLYMSSSALSGPGYADALTAITIPTTKPRLEKVVSLSMCFVPVSWFHVRRTDHFHMAWVLV